MGAESASILVRPFALVLPVARDRAGRPLVPLKPIVEALGIQWERQRTRVNGTPLRKRFGAVLAMVPRPDRRGRVVLHRMLCIRMDRVPAYLSVVNPNVVAGQGNDSAARRVRRHQAALDQLTAG